MKKVFPFIFILFFSCNNYNDDCSTYYLIRHAEKVRLDPENKDPELNDAGKKRALVWQEYFNDLEIDKVYSTNYKRTMQTVLPFTNSNELEISIYSPSKINYEEFLTSTIRDNVLIVGHSDTTPTFANELIKENVYPQMDDSNNANLYIVSICGDERNHEVIKIN
jgi:phosphohistidine phosphatase SixA